MTALVLTLALLAAPAGPARPETEEHKRAALVEKLRSDIFKVDRTLEQTERLIDRARGKPYLPDLHFRLCELYVQKSRYVHHLRAALDGEAGGGTSAEARLLKEKAISLYDRLLREYPRYAQADKATFYLAHEQRELGLDAEMLKTLAELVKRFPDSPLRVEAELIRGDHHFAKKNLADAEKHYRAALTGPPSSAQNLARYKLAWVYVNLHKHSEALRYFQGAVTAKLPAGADAKAVNLKREALTDMVYSYSEVKKAATAIPYFRKLADSRATFALALDKVAARFSIKQEYPTVVAALRELLRVDPDPSLDLERVHRLYTALRETKGKVLAEPEDVGFVVRSAVQARLTPELDARRRAEELKELEVMARDLATQLHLHAKKKDAAAVYARAAQAYGEYLSLFRPAAHVRTMMKNRADALFAASRYREAATQYEELARLSGTLDLPADQELAAYGALASHRELLKQKGAAALRPFLLADARAALKLDGELFLARYPKSARADEVAFNVARAYFEDGEYERAAPRFLAFALERGGHKDAVAAGHLALDSFRLARDYQGLTRAGEKLLASSLPSTFHESTRALLATAKGDYLQDLAIESAARTGDAVSGLLKVAEEDRGGELGQKALSAAVVAAREKKDLATEERLTQKLLAEYPGSTQATQAMVTLARRFAEVARFQEAAEWFQRAGERGKDALATDALRSAANLRIALGELGAAETVVSALAAQVSPGEQGSLFGSLAQAHLDAEDETAASELANRALAADGQSAKALAVLAQLQARRGTEFDAQLFARLAKLSATSPSSDAARGLWHAAEPLFRQYLEVPSADLQAKIAALQQLQGVYAQAADADVGAGAGEWAVAALWRAGLSYQALAEDLKAGEGGFAENEAQIVAEQAEALAGQADAAFKACLAKAAALELYAPAVMGCRLRREVERSSVAVARPAASEAPVPEELRQRVEKSPSAAALSALGAALLRSGRIAEARLTYARAIELPDAGAAAHGGLGLALLLSNDLAGAGSAYARALKEDGRDDRTRANLAALKCRLGDKEGAHRELSRVRASAVLNAADVDTHWRVCSDANG